MNFTELKVNPKILKAIEDMGFEKATEIQERAIPKILTGNDLIGKSQTGTGKTLAFAIPAIEDVDPSNKKVQVLILCPTRELALQISEEFDKLLVHMRDIKTVAIFGGDSMERQIRVLKKGVHIVIGTPGRVMDHMRRKTLKLEDTTKIILDEADEMLNMGFREDIELILKSIREDRQMILFSATMPKQILDIAEKYQKDPVLIEVAAKHIVAPGIVQKYFAVDRHNKAEALVRLIEMYNPQRSLIFCNTKMQVDETTDALQKLGYRCNKIHGDMRQVARLKVLEKFTRGELKILIATDVAARGIDVNDVDIVFNYDVPENEEYYVHRIGRTGRAGKDGLSLTLVSKRDKRRLTKVVNYTKKSIDKALLPTGDEINQQKKEQFLHRFKAKLDKVEGGKGKEGLKVYEGMLATLLDEGYSLEMIAAVLMQKQLPFKDVRDLNVVSKDKGSKKNRDRKDRDRKSRSGKNYSKSGKSKRIFISVGKKDNAQPRDILGAILGESGIPYDSVGEIEMYDKFSFAEIDEKNVDKVLDKLADKRIKGRKVKVELTKKGRRN
jgi:ATP-dependent RNA helicase DeaD